MPEEKKGDGQQGIELIATLRSEVMGILKALDGPEHRADRYDAQLSHFEFEEKLKRFREETKELLRGPASHAQT